MDDYYDITHEEIADIAYGWSGESTTSHPNIKGKAQDLEGDKTNE